MIFEDPLSFFEFNSSSGHEIFLAIDDSRKSKSLLGRLEAVIDSLWINGVLLMKVFYVFD